MFHDLRRTFANAEMERLLAKGHTVEGAADIASKELGHNRVEFLEACVGGE